MGWVKNNPLGGRPEKSKLSLFLSFVYLLYFEKDPIYRVINKINTNMQEKTTH
jgi:hypothetical protein